MPNKIILFTKQDGTPVRCVRGGIEDPDKYEDERLPPDFKWREISEEEAQTLFPMPEQHGGIPDSPSKQVTDLKKAHEALLEVLQELHGDKVDIKGMIETKKKAK